MLGTPKHCLSEALLKGITGFEEDVLTQHALDVMMKRKELDFGAPPIYIPTMSLILAGR